MADRGASRLRTSSSSPGFSGAGKSTAMNVFEDAGYFCVDNLPPEMIRALVELFVHEGSKVERAAVVSDVRGGEYFDALRRGARGAARDGRRAPRAVPRRRRADAADPLQGDAPPPPARRRRARVATGIAAERALLEPLQGARRRSSSTRAGSRRSTLRGASRRRVPAAPGDARALAVTFQSFGFKHGPPRDADLVFDVRFLPNPHWEPALRAADRARPARRRVRRPRRQARRSSTSGSSRCWTSCSREYKARARRTSRSRSAAPAGGIARSRSPSSSPTATGAATTSGSRSPTATSTEGARAGLS